MTKWLIVLCALAIVGCSNDPQKKAERYKAEVRRALNRVPAGERSCRSAGELIAALAAAADERKCTDRITGRDLVMAVYNTEYQSIPLMVRSGRSWTVSPVYDPLATRIAFWQERVATERSMSVKTFRMKMTADIEGELEKLNAETQALSTPDGAPPDVVFSASLASLAATLVQRVTSNYEHVLQAKTNPVGAVREWILSRFRKCGPTLISQSNDGNNLFGYQALRGVRVEIRPKGRSAADNLNGALWKGDAQLFATASMYAGGISGVSNVSWGDDYSEPFHDVILYSDGRIAYEDQTFYAGRVNFPLMFRPAAYWTCADIQKEPWYSKATTGR